MRFNREPNYSLLGVVGDVHGTKDWTVLAIDEYAKIGVTHILQLGDFGVGSNPRNLDFMESVNDRLKRHSMVMIITLGNHEDYDLLEAMLQPSKYDSNFLQLPEYDHLFFAARGQHWNWDGIEYCSLGGANSINKNSLKPHINWWPQESITLSDLYRINEGGSADIMLTHDCPEGVPILGALDSSDSNSKWPLRALEYAQESRRNLRVAVDTVKPELLLHGHYHVNADFTVELTDLRNQEAYSVRSVGLHMQNHVGNLRLLKPQTKEIEVFNPWPRDN